jgi:hypothetical protein
VTAHTPTRPRVAARKAPSAAGSRPRATLAAARRNRVFKRGARASPAHDLNSNSVLIPVAFGVETDVFTDPSGTVHTSTVPARAKGSSAPNGATLLNCSYHLALSLPNGASLAIDGTVTGFVTPGSG